jgi:hypothetical protein
MSDKQVYVPPTLIEVGDFAELTLGLDTNKPCEDWFWGEPLWC